MNRVNAAEEAAYLAEARSWETDKVQQAERSKRIAWRVAIGSAAIAGTAVAAVAMLVPLKTVEPFVIRVDRTTGIVDVVSPLKNTKPAYEETVSKYFLAKYLRAREGYSRSTAEADYETVALMSAPALQQQYYERFRPENPASPLNVYGSSAKVRIDVQGVPDRRHHQAPLQLPADRESDEGPQDAREPGRRLLGRVYVPGRGAAQCADRGCADAGAARRAAHAWEHQLLGAGLE